MKTKRTQTSTVKTDTWKFVLEDAPLLGFGQAGKLSPHTAWVEITTRDGVERTTIRAHAKNRNAIEMRGAWSAPKPTELAQHDYGYGGSGHIDDLPAEFVQALMDARYAPEAHAHVYAADIDWAEDGTMRSWTPTPCTCTRPWSHERMI